LRERSRPKSGLGVATGYLLSQWTPLSRHVDHGPTRLDNNLVENAIRLTVVGKKNWLFIATPTPDAVPPSSTRSSSPACATAKTPPPTYATCSPACPR
jgi:hypothetical protein